MRFVDMKTEAQLDMQTLHRSRERLVGERTALINQLSARRRNAYEDRDARISILAGT